MLQRSPDRTLPRWVVPALPVTVAALLTLPVLARSPLWADEVDSVSAATRTLPQLVLLLAHQDGPLAAYYLLLHGWVDLVGTSAWAVRLPSALALLGAVALTAEVGRNLGGRRAGLLAGLLLAVNPFVLGFGLDARPYAFAVLAAAGAALVLVRAGPSPSRRTRLAYAGWVVLGALAHLFFLLLVPAHLLALRLAHRSLRPWLVPSAAAVALLAPLLVLSAGQTFEVGYLHRPGLRSLPGWWQAMAGGKPWLAVPLALLVIAGLRRRRAGPHPLLVTWLLLPAPVLLLVSLVHPLFLNRYVVESAPALALWVALLLATDPPIRHVGAVAGGLLAASLATSLVTQLAPFRYEDPRAAADAVLDAARPGDGLVMLPTGVRTTIGYYLRRVDPRVARPADLLQVLSGTEARQGDFGGLMVPPAAARSALLRHRVVWLVRYADASAHRGATAQAVEADLARCYRAGPVRRFGLLEVRRETATGACAPVGRAAGSDRAVP